MNIWLIRTSGHDAEVSRVSIVTTAVVEKKRAYEDTSLRQLAGLVSSKSAQGFGGQSSGTDAMMSDKSGSRTKKGASQFQ